LDSLHGALPKCLDESAVRPRQFVFGNSRTNESSMYFLTIGEGKENLRKLGVEVLCGGAKEILFEQI